MQTLRGSCSSNFFLAHGLQLRLYILKAVDEVKVMLYGLDAFTVTVPFIHFQRRKQLCVPTNRHRTSNVTLWPIAFKVVLYNTQGTI